MCVSQSPPLPRRGDYKATGRHDDQKATSSHLLHLRNDFVIVSLYVDERTELPKNEQKTIKVNGREISITTIGNKWMAKQMQEYKTAAQPYYIIQTPDGKDVPVGAADYTNHSDPKVFQSWLEKGLKAYKK